MALSQLSPLRFGVVKVAFVVQRCGREVNGGAESLCLQVAQRMAKHWDTEILTTCALDYMTWENFYEPGSDRVDGALIRRFPVDHPRDIGAFNRLSAQLRPRQKEVPLSEQEAWMRAQGPVSSALLKNISETKDDYDAFIFFGYLYATTYFGLPLVRDRAYLAPFAHDEWTIYFDMWERLFAFPKKIIFSTPFERAFLQRRFANLALAGPVIGIGVDAPHSPFPDRFRQNNNIRRPFLLYVGRVDESKGCRWLIDSFVRARQDGLIPHKLVLIGREVMPIPFHDDIIHLGFVDEDDKWGAMAACDWLVNPSEYESLSIVLLEAWLTGRPCLVNGRSEVLTGHCRQAHGGLWYDGYAEWLHILMNVGERTKAILGSQGKDYVVENYSWDRIEHEYLASIA
jgi:glycosyltransferase involved in cell wall biosynthesis